MSRSIDASHESDRKIVFANRYFYPDESATSQMLTDLALQLSKSGFDIRIVTSRQRYDDASAELVSAETIAGIRVYRVWTSRFGRERLIGRAVDYLSFYATSAWRMWRLTRRGDVLVVKTDPPMLSIVGAVVAKLRGAVLINWLQDVFPEVATQLTTRRISGVNLLLAIRDASLRAAHCNVVLGMRMQEYLLARGIAGNSLRVIENWAHAVNHAGTGANRLRDEQSWRDKFVVMYSGNLGWAHEYETILGAARQLQQRTDIVFAIVGGGVKMRAMRQVVTTEGLQNVVFLPCQPRERLSDSLSAGDVHLVSLLPQLEGFIVPSKFYGILAVGRPAIFIGDQVGELARVIQGAHCGAVVRVSESSTLTDRILALCSDGELARTQGENARALFEHRYTLDAAVAKWLNVIERVESIATKTKSEPTPV